MHKTKLWRNSISFLEYLVMVLDLLKKSCHTIQPKKTSKILRSFCQLDSINMSPSEKGFVIAWLQSTNYSQRLMIQQRFIYRQLIRIVLRKVESVKWLDSTLTTPKLFMIGFLQVLTPLDTKWHGLMGKITLLIAFQMIVAPYLTRHTCLWKEATNGNRLVNTIILSTGSIYRSLQKMLIWLEMTSIILASTCSFLSMTLFWNWSSCLLLLIRPTAEHGSTDGSMRFVWLLISNGSSYLLNLCTNSWNLHKL